MLVAASAILYGTPILYAALGELLAERSGVLNLGVEGMMITGAICGFVVAVNTGSAFWGFVAAAGGGAALSLIFGLWTQVLLSNQVATGLALTLFGLGLSSLMGQDYQGLRAPGLAPVASCGTSDISEAGCPGTICSVRWREACQMLSTPVSAINIATSTCGTVLAGGGSSSSATTGRLAPVSPTKATINDTNTASAISA